MKRLFRVATIAMFSGVMLMPATSLAQRGGGPGGFRGGGGGMMGGDGIMGLLQRQEVRQEIQLVDEQQEQLEAISDDLRDEMRSEMRDVFSQMRDLSDDERRARFDEIRARMEEIRSGAETRVQKVLLPHQFERLKQIDVQSRIQRQGASALTGGELAKTLNLTGEQQEKLRERAEEVQREMDEQIRQLRVEARNKLLDVLSPEQRAKLESLMGEQIALPDQPFNRGGRFGRGGERGRRGNN